MVVVRPRVVRCCWAMFLMVVASGCGLVESVDSGPKARNVILLIGDGMGFEQVRAAGMYAHGQGGSLFFETLPYQGQMTTHSADAAITDSAASATAMATGYKVDNGVISMAIPGDRRELPTLLELFQQADKKCGLVTTVPLTHATPACFGAHEPSRGNAKEIGQDYLRQTRPAVLFGGGRFGLSAEIAKQAGYVVVQDRKELLALDAKGVVQVMGLFDVAGETVKGGGLPYEVDGLGKLPHLSELTEVALAILEKSEKGFFLMVEGGKIDWSGHANDLARNIGETVAFDRAVEVVCRWARGRKDTLIVVTSDHETGGLKVLNNKGQNNEPEVSWGTGGHTDVVVPVYALGIGGESFVGRIDNTDIFKKIVAVSGVAAPSK